MKNLIKLFNLACIGVIALLFPTACNSPTTPHPDSPTEFVCVIDYAGSIFSPIPSSAPFNYEIRDINGKFLAYVDTSRIVSQRVERFMGKCVVIRGHLIKLDGKNVLRADTIKLQR